MAIKDVALAYVAIANCLEVFILHKKIEMNDEFERQDNKEYLGTILTDTDNLSIMDNVSTSRGEDVTDLSRASTWNA